MANWEQEVQALKDEHKSNPWSPYAPQAKQGFDLLAKNVNLACVLCPNLVKAIYFTENNQIKVDMDGSITIGCDHDMGSGYKKVSLIPNSSVKGGGTIGPNSENGCSRDLINR